MHNQHVMHIVDSDTRTRAELAPIALALGHHVEVYADIEELCARPPERGIVAVRDDVEPGGVQALVALLLESGMSLRLVAMEESPDTGRGDSTIKAGAFDCLALPLALERLTAIVAAVAAKEQAHAQARRRRVEVRSLIGGLSARERQVLDWLTQGCRNKAIAHELQISPRTAEIHRANMMAKLGTQHSAVAVGLRRQASL